RTPANEKSSKNTAHALSKPRRFRVNRRLPDAVALREVERHVAGGILPPVCPCQALIVVGGRVPYGAPVPSTPDFHGCVIGESLRDPTIINHLRVWKAWISPEGVLSDDDGSVMPWHIYWVTCEVRDIDRIQSQLKPWRWYAHFWRHDEMIVVFCD